jgi:2-oxo-3-hexenedioate decarboxylase
MPIDNKTVDTLSARLLGAIDAGKALAPVTDEHPGFDLADAYRVSAAVRQRRVGRGDRLAGWKIGFTNRSVWSSFGIDAPIWGPMYDTTVSEMKTDGTASFSLDGLAIPRIEPEIALRLSKAPDPGMNEDELLASVDAVTHGFEIVQSVYPDWKFKAADGIAAASLHARYVHGPLVPVEPSERERWARMLPELSIAILRDGVEMDRGRGTAVLDGPVSALRHLVANMAKFPDYALRPGDLVTTGTITNAFPIARGERWTTRVEGAPLPGLDLRLT